MTFTRLPVRCDTSPDVEMVADTVARMLDTGDRITAGGHHTRGGWLSLFLADARLLAEAVTDGQASRDLLEEVANRLWMVCAAPEEITAFAASVEASRKEKLLCDRDVINISRGMIRDGRLGR